MAEEGFDSASSYERKRGEAAARRRELIERRRQLETQMRSTTDPGDAPITVGRSD